MSEPHIGDRLLADLLDGGILVVTPAPDDAAGTVEAGCGIATLLQPDGDVVTLLAGPAGVHGAAALARHADAVQGATRAVRLAGQRLRRRARLAALAGPLLMGVGIAAALAVFGRVPGPAAWGWLASLGALAGLAGAAASLAPLLGRTALQRARAPRTAAANRAWLADHGFKIDPHGLSSPASSRRA